MSDQLPSKQKKRLDLLFVHPSFTNVYQKKHEALAYPALEPPYRAALTAEFIRNKGYSVDILETNVYGLSIPQSVEKVREYNPRLVQIEVHGNHPSASSQLMDWVTSFTKQLKEHDPSYKVLLTGTHPAALPERTLQDGSGDFVGRGDGFYTTLGLLQGRPLADIPGLFWYERNNEKGRVMNGAKFTLMEPQEMNEALKRAAWDLLPIEEYRAHDWHCLDDLKHRKPYMSMYTSFGCPFNCSFCCINATFNNGGELANKIRCRDPKIVVDEIEEVVKKHGAHPGNKLNMKIIDEMFVFKIPHYTGIAQEIINRGLGDTLNTWAYARVDTIKEGNLDLLKKAGFNWLALGIESGSAHVRNGVEKGRFNDTNIFKNVKAVQNAGIYVVGNYIFGLPDDTKGSMQETYDMAVALECERPNFYSAMAYPGSRLHSQANNTGALLRRHGAEALELIASSNTATIEYNQDKKPQEQREPPYLSLPKEFDPARPLLPEDTDKGGPGWIGYTQHGWDTINLPTASLLPEVVLEFRDKALMTYFTDPNYLGMVAKKFGEKTAQDFKEMNAVMPKRKLLGHVKN